MLKTLGFPISTRVTKLLFDQLKEKAETFDVPISRLVRVALWEFCDNHAGIPVIQDEKLGLQVKTLDVRDAMAGLNTGESDVHLTEDDGKPEQ